ncbi:nucleoporin Nup43-like [Mercenaria mercenaria]|uniref:nucleoporin Nup43-like n=1 Tax=Mercenaria mercenaria TaxID=6596 RepID=UPI00234EB17E|nr:nucleoporin Nup43-like [Mercenaria mercenaria]
MDDSPPIVKFVSQKISKIRWKPNQNQYSHETDVFATGNWDDEAGKVCLWKLPSMEQEVMDMEAGGYDPAVREPNLLCEVPHTGDVTDLEFISADHVVSSSSTGTVTLYRHHTNSQTLGASMSWEGIHKDPGDKGCPCTCLTTQGEDMVVSAGEDGRINVLNVAYRKPVRVIDKANSCTINGITFLKQLEVISVDSSGQLKVFDLRQASGDPVRTFALSGEQTPLQCVARHPTQYHIVATGAYDGVLSVWDLRQEKFPVTPLEAHSAAIWEVKFHPNNPDHLFTCSEDGSVWHWNASSVASLVTGTGAGSGGGSLFSQNTPTGGAGNMSITSPWLVLDSGRQKLDVKSKLSLTLPLNTIDIVSQILLCGSDEEAIYAMDIPGIR